MDGPAHRPDARTGGITGLRFAFFIQDLRGGGAERSVVRLVNGLAESGESVDLVVVTRKGVFIDELDPRVNLIALDKSRTGLAVLALRSYLKRARPDVLFSTMTHANIAAILANVFPTKLTRLVVVEHNQFSRNVVSKSGTVLLAYKMAGLLYPYADAVAGVTDGVLDDLVRTTGLEPRRRAVLQNPVMTPAFHHLANEPADHPWFKEPGSPVVLAVGRLQPQKNYPLLIRAFSDLRRRREVRLAILGEGELRSELETIARSCGVADDVAFLGFLPNPLPFMRQAGVFALSSDWEGLPTVLIEALGAGCPVVSTDCPSGPREILENGRHGRLIPVGDRAALAEALDHTLREPGDRESRLARAACFDTASAVAGYVALAQDLARPDAGAGP